ncbi:hypothetical protein GE061_014038 [Apolygus lucorum]|uniref:Pre-mRNA-splicing factor 18 n=1 Tax=Apolygus lucorum TaxID=248454 RepID=A0A8S9XS65_APOLU|nr:hypothetical protein GE061_014038 [Apolygus lucorum]
MDILKQEIERKKRQLEEKKLLQPAKKYFKRSELVKLEQQEYYDKYGEAGQSNDQGETSDSIKVRANEMEDQIGEISTLPRKEVIKRLRERCEPILLFAETELESFKRLRKREILEPELNKGLRNDFQEAMDEVDQAYLDELLQTQQAGSSVDLQKQKQPKEKLMSYEEIQEMSAKLGKGDAKYDMNVIVNFLQLLMRLWGDELNNREDSEKLATKGKMALATYKQTQLYLKPLVNKLKNHSLPEDISDSLTSIVRYLLDRNYIQASDAYLEMAIGNAPWPIGVTMTAIEQYHLIAFFSVMLSLVGILYGVNHPCFSMRDRVKTRINSV